MKEKEMIDAFRLITILFLQREGEKDDERDNEKHL